MATKQHTSPNAKYTVLVRDKATFIDSKLEQAYLLQMWQQMFWFIVLGLAIIMGIEIFTMMTNFHKGVADAVSPAVYYLRLATIIPGIGILVLLLIYKGQLKALNLFNIYAVWYMLLKTGNMALLPHLGDIGPANLIASTLFVYLLFPMTWRQQIALGLSFSYGVLITWLFIHDFGPSVSYLITWVTGTNLLGALIANRRQIADRFRYYQQISLERAAKQTAALNDLLTHELRTPLTTVRLQAEMLKNPEANNKERIGEYIFANTQALISLLDNWLLANQNIDVSGGHEISHPEVIFKQAIEDTHSCFPDNPIVFGNHALPALSFDERVLLLSLKSILSNAGQYAHTDKGVRINTYTNGKYLGVAIRDWGMGMPAEQLAELFARRSAVKADLGNDSSSHGLGVGMHLLSKLVSTSGGEIKAYSKPDSGTLIVLWLLVR